MQEWRKKAREILISELSKKDLEIWEKLSDMEGIHFATKSKNGKKNRLYLEALNLDK